jgi:hypothetical protein
LVVVVSGTSYGFTDSEHYVSAASRIGFMSASLVVASAVVLFATVCRRLIPKDAPLLPSVYRYLRTAKLPAISFLVVGMFAGAAVLQEYGLVAVAVYAFRAVYGTFIAVMGASIVVASAVVLFAPVYRYLRTAKLLAISLLVVGTCAGAAVLQQYGLDAFVAVYAFIAVYGPFIAVLATVTAGAGILCAISCRSALSNKRVVLAAGFLIAFSVFGHYHAWLYLPLHAPDNFGPFWADLVGKLGGHMLWKILIIATAFLSTLIVLGVTNDDFHGRVETLCRIIPYSLIGMTAYVIVCSIAAGYVFSAYQVRNTPFAIYLSAVAGAGAVYILSCLAWQWSSQLIAGCQAITPSNIVWAGARTMLVSAILAVIAGVWITLQATYLSRIPPQRMASMFQALDKIAGASTVVSNYATPVAIRTGQWSYLDNLFFQRGAWFDSRGYHVTTQDFRYLWFGDWKSNPVYRRPEYFVCWLHLYFFNVVSSEKQPMCGELPGLKEIRNGNSLLKHKEVFRDERYDLWSIVKLDWDYPPYLLPLDESSPDTKVRAAFVPRADGIGFTVEIDPKQQEGRPIMGVHYRLYVDPGDYVTCDVSRRRLFQVGDSSADLLLPKKFKGCIQIGVVPFTATKTGSEYYSGMIVVGEGGAALPAETNFKHGPR